MTSMWMVQNDDGGWLQHSGEQFYSDYGYAMKSKIAMNNWIIANPDVHAHLVEMVPAKPKVPVSREEAELIDDAKSDSYPATRIARESGFDNEDRLMRAYVNGYTVVEPTKYNVKVPHTANSYYAKRSDSSEVGTLDDASNWFLAQGYMQFTMDEIKHYGLEDCERVEINTEDSDE